jgi:uncharacterized membrane protein required for colicin V production
MSTVIDIALVIIVAFCAWRGFRNGVIRGICGVLAIIISLYGANLIAKAYSGEFTGMLEPFVSGVVDNAVNDVLDIDIIDDPADTQGDAADTSDSAEDGAQEHVTDTGLTDEEKSDVYSVSYAALKKLGIAEKAAAILAEKVNVEMDSIGQSMTANLTVKLCEALAYIAVFGISFILLSIIFAVIGNIINLAFSIPGIEQLDKIIGIFLGLIKGLLIVFALAVIIRYIGLLSAGTIRETVILNYILNENPIAKLLGI